MTDSQVDIRSASFRILRSTPGHITYGVWINGGKCGDLVVRQEERVGLQIMMKRGGFVLMEQYQESEAKIVERSLRIARHEHKKDWPK